MSPMKNKLEKPRHRIKMPAWLFIPLALLYDELLLHFWISTGWNLGRLLCVVFFSLSLGLLLGFLCTIGKIEALSRAIAIVLSTLFCVLYMTEYLINDAFMNFMSLSSIATGANDVVGDFGNVVVSLILKEFWRILLMALPILLYAFFTHGKAVIHSASLRCALLFGCVFTFCLGYFSVVLLSPDAKKYNTEYDFDNAVHAFGLSAALRLDLTRSNKATSTGFSDVDVDLDTPEATASTDSPAVTVYADNVMDIDFAALADTETDATIAAVHSYVAKQTPSKQNEYTGLFKGKNLIFISAEALSLYVIDKDLTPTLYRLANSGIQFTDYYQPAWGGSTSTGEYSNLVGLAPTDGVNSIQDTIGHNMYLTIGNQLMRLGYHSIAYHNNSYTYYDRDKTHTNLGYEQFIGMGNGMEEGVTQCWPESDVEMIDFTLPQYIDQQPFNIYYMSVSGHGNYSRTGNTMSNKNYDAVADLPYSEAVKAYLAAQLELEYALEHLVAGLEEAGIADDTVIVISPDHYPYSLDESAAWGTDEDYLSELYGTKVDDCFTRDKTCLIIWSGCIEDMHLKIDTPVYSLDILPTLSNLFGVEYDSRLLVGRDVFSTASPLVFWLNYSWITDKGTYDSSTGTFTPAVGEEAVSEDYISTISTIVKNRINFSRSVLNTDYYNVLFSDE